MCEMAGESSSEALDFVLKSLEKFEANFKRLIDQLRGIGESQGLARVRLGVPLQW